MIDIFASSLGPKRQRFCASLAKPLHNKIRIEHWKSFHICIFQIEREQLKDYVIGQWPGQLAEKQEVLIQLYNAQIMWEHDFVPN